MNYLLRLPALDENDIPLEFEDNKTGLVTLKRLETFSFDRNVTPDSQWVEFAITCATAVPLSILANIIYDRVFKGKAKIIEKSKEEITIEKPDGSMIHIKRKQTRSG